MDIYARMDGDVVAEIIEIPEGHSIEGMYVPDLAATMVRVTGDIPVVGMILRPDGAFVAAPLPLKSAAEINASIYARLAMIDAKSVRPLRSILEAMTAGLAADPADTATLADLNAQADALRAQLVVT